MTRLRREAIERVADVLERSAGLRFEGSRLEALRSATGTTDDASLGEYADRLEWDDGLVADLLDRVTVGETYFRRGLGHYERLRDEILPSLLRRLGEAGGRREIRIWSAGCATGEEPYTIAILLRRMGVSERVWILGTDVNRAALEGARRARYRKWSFRGTTDDFAHSYFRKRGNHYELHSDIRKMVEFRRVNLVSDAHPSCHEGRCDFDVIVCRNVLIYMTAEHQQRVGRKLVGALRPGGWLLPGASDPRLHDIPGCSAEVSHIGLVYRRVADPCLGNAAIRRIGDPANRASTTVHGSSAGLLSAGGVEPLQGTAGNGEVCAEATDRTGQAWPSTEKPAPGSPDAAGREPEGLEETPRDPTVGLLHEARAACDEGSSVSVEALERRGAEAEAWARLIRHLADRGKLEAADRTVARALEHFPEASPLHLLRALVLGEAGRVEEALHAARAALYLDDTNVLAYATMGTLLLRSGEELRAEAAFAHALRLRSTMGPVEAVPGFEGMDTEAALARLSSRPTPSGRRGLA